ncbi:hypothetical protein DPMN_174091 [Dreissena polymorpha]|uniref:Uncharacterized protein n=1 Tax=Dreissena polymorpha TaxID=45954 RepID=A0A9D4IEU6_DREPO|nr:hypothetical protein DPMN_174091 [Dreissena polymorpha]
MNRKWPPGGHVFFNRPEPFLNSSKICPNFTKIMCLLDLTCFHYVHIKKTAPPPGSHVFPLITTIFKLVRDIHIANAKNVTSRNPPPGGHVFLPIQTIFELNCRIQRPCFFQPIGIIYELVQDIIGMNVLTKFHEDRTINVASRVKNAPSLGSHVFQAKATIFEMIQDIIGTNHLSKFHEDWTINVASRVLTRKNAPPPGGHVFNPPASFSNLKNAPPLGSHVFQANVTIFELIQDIIETNLLAKFHEDWTINVASRE